jgi:heptosyltransferase-3
MIDAPRRILVIQVSRIGDTLFITPSLNALATAFPAAEITVMAHPKRLEVLQNLPFVHHVRPISKRSAVWRGRLGYKPFDLALVYGFDQPLVAYALRVARRVAAFRQKDEALNHRLDVALAPPAFQHDHAVEYYLRLAEALGAKPVGRRIHFRVTPEERSWAQERLAAEGLAGHRPLIGLQVASFPTRAYRDWPIESFLDLCQRLTQGWPDARFLIFGGPEEKQRTAWLKQQLGERAALFAGRLSLRQTGALMSLTHLYVGVDTGPTHLMSSFDIPLVGLYHCTSGYGDTGPLDHPCAELLNHPLTGNGCTEQASMADIPVEAVHAAAVRLLESAP